MSRRIAPPRLARPLRSPTAVAAGTVLVLALATPAGAEGEEIIIRPTTVIIGAPGTVHTVADMPVAPSLVGKPCDLRVVTQNQSSVHPGTDVMVSTGSARSVIEGVEDSPDGRVVDTHRVTLGDDILVEVMIGPDGATSLGFTLSFECSPDQLLPTVAPSQQTTTTVAGGPTTGPTVSAPLTGDSTTPPGQHRQHRPRARGRRGHHVELRRWVDHGPPGLGRAQPGRPGRQHHVDHRRRSGRGPAHGGAQRAGGTAHRPPAQGPAGPGHHRQPVVHRLIRP